MAKKKTVSTDEILKSINFGLQLKVSQLRRTSQDIQNWRNALRSAESVMNPNRKQLYTLYFEIILDGHLKAVLNKRKIAIQKTKVKFVNANGEEFDERITMLLQTPWFYKMLGHIIDSKFWGHSLIEFLPLQDNIQEVGDVNLINRFHVNPHFGIVMSRDTDRSGLPYREEPYNRYAMEVGDKDDLGLLNEAAQYVIYKRGGFGDWAQFAEIFGMPFREGKYDGHDQATRKVLEEALEAAGSAAYAVIPKESEINFHNNNASASGSKDLYKGLIEACDEALSKLFLGQTMTTDNGSSRSQSDTHREVEEEIFEADRQWIEYILNWDLRHILNEGFGYNLPADGKFVFNDDEPIDKVVDRVVKLAPYFHVDADWATKTFNIPMSNKQTAAPPNEGKIKLNKSKGNFIQLNKTIAQAYKIGKKDCCGNIIQLSIIDDDSIEYKSWFAALNKAYNSLDDFANDGKLDEEKLMNTVQQLNKGFAEGAGIKLEDIDFSTPNYSLYESARLNLFNFGGAKTYQELIAYNELFVTESGAFPSFNVFKERFNQVRQEVLNIDKTYNQTWLRTEYNTAIAQAEAIEKWQEHQRDKELYPYLIYRTLGDSLVREEHEQLNGVIRAVDDDFWDMYFPPNDWNCRCYVEGTTSTPEEGRSYDDKDKNVAEPFANNVGKTGTIFKDNHPYYKGVPQQAKKQAIELANVDYVAKQKQNFDMYKSEGQQVAIEFNAQSGGYAFGRNIPESDLQALKNLVDQGIGIRQDVQTAKYMMNNAMFDLSSVVGKSQKAITDAVQSLIITNQNNKVATVIPGDIEADKISKAIKSLAKNDDLEFLLISYKNTLLKLDKRILSNNNLLENALKTL